MVAKITMPKSAQKALAYNELKVANGKAISLGGDNCLGEPQYMNLQKKLAILQNRNVLNDRARTKTIHVSLNFDPAEKLTAETLKKIASLYMSKIGFEEQPYFIYQHHDAGHPHIHIVSSIIRPDGSRINTHNMGRNQSEEARKKIEQEFGLVKAGKKKNILNERLISILPEKVVYGKEETKRSIASVLNGVITQYNYTSLAELNAVLNQYKVTADNGVEKGSVNKKRGLCYRMLDQEGNRIGVPLKASALPGKPTLSYLEQRIEMNKLNREMFRQNLTKLLDDVLMRAPKTAKELWHLLSEKNIDFLVLRNGKANSNEITFIDNRNKCVFNGSDIGDEYSVFALQKRLFFTVDDKFRLEEKRVAGIKHNGETKLTHQPTERRSKSSNSNNILQQPLLSESCRVNIPALLLQKNKKEKRKNL